MNTLINQYSFIATGLFLLIMVSLTSWRLVGARYAIPITGLTFVLLIAFQILFSANANPYPNIETFDNALGSGKPVFVVLYSDL